MAKCLETRECTNIDLDMKGGDHRQNRLIYLNKEALVEHPKM